MNISISAPTLSSGCACGGCGVSKGRGGRGGGGGGGRVRGGSGGCDPFLVVGASMYLVSRNIEISIFTLLPSAGIIYEILFSNKNVDELKLLKTFDLLHKKFY